MIDVRALGEQNLAVREAVGDPRIVETYEPVERFTALAPAHRLNVGEAERVLVGQNRVEVTDPLGVFLRRRAEGRDHREPASTFAILHASTAAAAATRAARSAAPNGIEGKIGSFEPRPPRVPRRSRCRRSGCGRRRMRRRQFRSRPIAPREPCRPPRNARYASPKHGNRSRSGRSNPSARRRTVRRAAERHERIGSGMVVEPVGIGQRVNRSASAYRAAPVGRVRCRR